MKWVRRLLWFVALVIVSAVVRSLVYGFMHAHGYGY